MQDMGNTGWCLRERVYVSKHVWSGVTKKCERKKINTHQKKNIRPDSALKLYLKIKCFDKNLDCWLVQMFL